uniref:Uncharacterized protein n=1 Tax=Pyxicephalus adspersus TaxID=30357 RepID=A0AAV2ZSJ9_PYXAD|nr:TPA: hypothetical protein GDO54_005645 [Pyxicephalus adspersus]
MPLVRDWFIWIWHKTRHSHPCAVQNRATAIKNPEERWPLGTTQARDWLGAGRERRDLLLVIKFRLSLLLFVKYLSPLPFYHVHSMAVRHFQEGFPDWVEDGGGCPSWG